MPKRKILVLAMTVLLTAGAASAGTWKTTIAEARAEARAKDRLILVDMYADWCGWCKKMALEVFPSEAFQNRAKDLVLLKVDTEDGKEGTKLANDMGVTTLPTFLLLTPDMTLAGTIRGYAPAQQFVKQIDATVASWKSFQTRLAEEPKHADDYAWRLALAKDFMIHENFVEAEKRLNAMVSDKKLPKTLWSEVSYHLALCQASQGNYTVSEKTLNDLLKRESKGAVAEQATLFKAQLLFQERKYKTALAELKRFQTAYPESSLLPNVLRMMPVFERAASTQ